VIHRVETWSTGSGYRNGVSELNASRGILRKSESPWIRFISTPGHSNCLMWGRFSTCRSCGQVKNLPHEGPSLFLMWGRFSTCRSCGQVKNLPHEGPSFCLMWGRFSTCRFCGQVKNLPHEEPSLCLMWGRFSTCRSCGQAKNLPHEGHPPSRVLATSPWASRGYPWFRAGHRTLLDLTIWSDGSLGRY
jgi:hypothetical protein